MLLLAIKLVNRSFFYSMGRTINSAKLTKAYVLSKVSQETIFATYLSIDINIVKHCINTNELIISPLRCDNHPTCGFKYDNRGKLKFRDFAGYIWGDCFDIAALVINNIYKINLQINNKKDFISVLRHITLTFKDIFYGEEKDENLINSIDNAIIAIRKQKPIIELVVRQWNEADREYWAKFGVTLQYLNLNFVYPVDQYYINRNVNPEPKYYYNMFDPCYAYGLGKDRHGINGIKLYFPLRGKDSNTRFITNCNHLEGIYNLDRNDYDYIILTKSSKDRLSIGCSIKTMCSLYGGFNKIIGVINIPHETYKLKEHEYNWLIKKLNVNGMIISLMDNDRVGKLEAIWLHKHYNITPILIPANSGCKDYAEYYNKTDLKLIYSEITNLINNLRHYERKNNISARNTETDTSLPF